MSPQPAIDLKRLLQPVGQNVPVRSKLAFAAPLTDLTGQTNLTGSAPSLTGRQPEAYVTSNGSSSRQPATLPPVIPLANIAARLRETHFYAYLKCGNNSCIRTVQSLARKAGQIVGKKINLPRRRLLQTCALLLPCLTIGLAVNIWLQAFAGAGNYSLRQQLDPAAHTRHFPSQAEVLSRLAEAEDSPSFSRPRNWRISQKIVPLAFASSLPAREARPEQLAWTGREAPAPQGSLLSLGKKSPLFRTLAGEHALPQATDFAFSGPSEPYAANQMQRIATGEQAAESLLAEFRDNPDLLRGRFVALRVAPSGDGLNNGFVEGEIWDETPAWSESENRPGDLSGRMILVNSQISDPTAEFAYGLQCRSDRMELASWLGEMRRESLSLSLRALERASKYSNYVERYSTDYELPPSLVYAIMRTESSFNPNAVSIANALGLMQVVPQTAGGEVYAFLTGKNGTPGRDVLFRPESNIQYGTAYLHLLNSRHFKDVENHISRELCIIAAYNGGPNAVLRSFDRDKAKAVEKINKFTPEQLYTTLVRKLPSQETRDYVVKVVEARNKFRHNLSF